jgi:predicted dinucleotide-binding enzyme
MTMSIGIIGAGNIGLAVAKTLSRAGIVATIANSRGPESLKESVAALGPTIKAGTREQAAGADIVLIAVNWSKLPAAVAGLPAWGGRIVTTPTIRSKPRCSSRSICTALFQARWSPIWWPAHAS